MDTQTILQNVVNEISRRDPASNAHVYHSGGGCWGILMDIKGTPYQALWGWDPEAPEQGFHADVQETVSGEFVEIIAHHDTPAGVAEHDPALIAAQILKETARWAEEYKAAFILAKMMS
jgi:hypothetical protein